MIPDLQKLNFMEYDEGIVLEISVISYYIMQNVSQFSEVSMIYSSFNTYFIIKIKMQRRLTLNVSLDKQYFHNCLFLSNNRIALFLKEKKIQTTTNT